MAWYVRNHPLPTNIGMEEVSSSRYRVIRDRNILWLWVDGIHYRLENKARGTSGDSISKDSLAPMTAKVVEVLVKVGGDVIVGDTLVVLSAMKMEYVVKATVAGKIELLQCGPGDMVEQGQLLVKLI